MATNSPGVTFRLKWRRAWVSTTSVRKTLPTFCISIMCDSSSVREARFGHAREILDPRHDDRLAFFQARDDLDFAHAHGTERDVTFGRGVAGNDVGVVAGIREGAALDFQRVGTLVEHDAHAHAL